MKETMEAKFIPSTLRNSNNERPTQEAMVEIVGRLEEELAQKNQIIRVWIANYQQVENKRRQLKAEARQEFAVLERKLNYLEAKNKQYN